MSDFPRINEPDADRMCEHCKTPVLKTSLSRFGILQNCDNVFCYICANTFWKEVKNSKSESEFYLECPVCHIKSCSFAASTWWIEKREDKMVYFDKLFEAIEDLPCEFCHKGNDSCVHVKKYILNLDIDGNKPLSVFKFDNSSHQLHPPDVLLGSNLSSIINKSIQHKKPLTEEKETTLKACLSEVRMFSEEDFPPLGYPVTMASKTELLEDKVVVDSSTDISNKNKISENLTEKELESSPILSTPTPDSFLTIENETFKACSSETRMFSKEDFITLGESATMVSKTELLEDKKDVVDSYLDISYKNKLKKNLTEKEPESSPILSTTTLDLLPENNKPLPPGYSLENDSVSFLPREMLPECPVDTLDISNKNKLAENLAEKEPESSTIFSIPKIDLPPEYNKPLSPEYSLENYSQLSFLPDEMLPEYPTHFSTNYQKCTSERKLNKYISELFCSIPYNDFNLSDNIPPGNILSNNLHVKFSKELQSSKVVNNILNSELKAERRDEVPKSGNSQTSSSPCDFSQIYPLTDLNAKPTPSFEDHARKNTEHHPQASIFTHYLNLHCLQGFYNTEIRNNLNGVHRLKAFQNLTGNINPSPEKISDCNKPSGSNIGINRSIWQGNSSKHEGLNQLEFELAPINSGLNLKIDSIRSNWTFNQYPSTPNRDSSKPEIPFQQENEKHQQIFSKKYLQQEPKLYAYKQTNHKKQRENNFRNSRTNLNYQMEFSYRNFRNSNLCNTNQINLNGNLNSFYQPRLQSLDDLPADLRNHLQFMCYNQFPRSIYEQIAMGRNFKSEKNYYLQLQKICRETWWANVRRQVQMFHLLDQIYLFNLIHANVRGSLEAYVCFPYRNQVVYPRLNYEESTERQTSISDDGSNENIARVAEKRR